jgi:hypothetical protein
MDNKIVFVVFGGFYYESSMVYGVFNFKADAEAFKKSRLADADNPLDYLSIEEFKVQ